MIQEIKREVSRLEITSRTLRNFGMLFWFIFGVWAGKMYWKAEPHWLLPAGASMAFLVLSFFFPMILRQPYRLWMLLAFFLGWLMTRVILSLAFFVIMTPIGIFLKFLRKDILNKEFQKDAETYWNKYEPIKGKERYNK